MRFVHRIVVVFLFLSLFTLMLTQPSFAADTGWANPSLNFPDASTGDGFEITPENAYSNGAGAATSKNNPSPGAETSRYYGFSFSFPAGATILGIEVRLDWWMNQVPTALSGISTGMTWNGGLSWSSSYAEYTVPASETTTVFGGPTDQWSSSHQWTVSELTSLQFQVYVQVIYPVQDAQGVYEVYLDWVAVKVYYDSGESTPSNGPRYVGGELYCANKLAVLSPYLALISIVAVAAVLVKRRKL